MRSSPLLLVLATVALVQVVQAEPRALQPDGDLDYYRSRVVDFSARNPGLAPPDYYLAYADVDALRPAPPP